MVVLYSSSATIRTNKKRRYNPITRILLCAISLLYLMATNIILSAPLCSRWVPQASGKLLDTSNLAAPSLSSHWEAIKAKRAEDAARQHCATTPSSSVGSGLDQTPTFPLLPVTTDLTEIGPESDPEYECQHHEYFNMHSLFQIHMHMACQQGKGPKL